MRSLVAHVALIVCVALSTAHAGVATFDNFTEGDFFFGSFTDPVSGITFLDATGPDPGEFIIDFAEVPGITTGNYLSSAGLAPGPGIALPLEFGFRGALPTPADEVLLRFAYGTDPGASMRLEGFDADDNLIALTTLVPPSGAFLESSISIESTLTNIHSFKVTPENLFVAYGLVEFVPEPTAAAAVLGITLVALRSRRSRV